MKRLLNVRWVVRSAAVAMFAYHLYIALTGVPEPMIVRPVHVGFVLFIGFLTIRARERDEKGAVPWFDWLLAFAGTAAAFYVLLDYERIVWRLPYFDALTRGDWVVGVLTLLLVLELARRTVGWALPIIVAVVVLSTLYGRYMPPPFNHAGVSAERILDHLFLSTKGLYGSLASLSLSLVFMFIAFGAFLQLAGGSEFFSRIIMAVTRRATGGPAKGAVIGSALFGSISGSGVANVFATGTITIPLMIRAGFKPTFAAAVESVASQLGQLIPPVMGAAAFLVAEFSRVSYAQVAAAAALPALLYVFALYVAVHFEARRSGIGRFEEAEETPGILSTLWQYGHVLLPMAVLVYLLSERMTGYYAATIATLAIVVVSWLRPHTRMTPRRLLEAIETTVSRIVGIGAVLFSAGLAVATLELTGVPFRITALLVALSGDNLLVALLIIGLITIVLGFGLPVTASFLIASLFGAAALMQMGVPTFVAYMYIFMFALTANITPPVCVTTFAAASIAKAPFMRAGVRGFMLGIPAYVVPIMIVYEPTLLNIFERGVLFGLQALLTALVGVTALVAGTQGWLLQRTNWAQRAILVVSSVSFLLPGSQSDLLGAAGLVLVMFWQMWEGRRLRVSRAIPGQ